MHKTSAHQARKRFGQNFLHDPWIIQKIVHAISPKRGQNLVEIGPGQGAITQEILKIAGRLTAIELDRDLIEPLALRCATLGRLQIYSSDALRFDFCSLLNGAENEKLRIIGNLPYNISTPILFHLLAQSRCIQDMHFMLQKEVVDRMAAAPGSKRYGRLSVMLQIACEVRPLFDIGPGAFKPAPKVDSAFVRLIPHTSPRFTIEDTGLLNQIVTQAFGQRRKTLRNSLRKLVNDEIYAAIAIDPSQRAEQISVGQFVDLANHACKTAQTT